MYVDMDGVLVDYFGGALARFGRPVEDVHDTDGWLPTVLGVTLQEVVDATNDVEFWSGLDRMPDADRLLEACEAAGDFTYLLTSPGDTPRAAEGKRLWVRRNYPRLEENLIIAHRKEACASTSSILVDDFERNTLAFHAEGGSSILVPRPWNRMRGASPLETVLPALIAWRRICRERP